MMEWLINAPVWIQTPLVFLALFVVCTVLALVWQVIALRIFPASAEEERVHGALSLRDMWASRSSVPLDDGTRRPEVARNRDKDRED
ncbi:hypothetical protein COJE103337_07055 [Corynebacterium jeikeium]|uniref:Uncharacterized protein n=1 Tax=Corynebacterium jeikeium (strain K411) TaxID=306537 RepID=Q4JWQ3_CORJK|nr:hypothetical protein [Corynebacterium jeikeium]EEW16822.1 hypothetical protein HMPREF0297_0754 [Corynebacterium jeikeium ATCC 43734]OOD30210.1 hypothetical protein BWP03_07905 [Corynebacterium jeikeium]WCZ53151.1 hypothetical protein CJEIK_03130 [Corynebacterium jeikeium]CAI36754.1 hypothetical protein jk0595 [Corynebacterium jeikeium K411]SCX08245.1 hypothetical protein CJBVI_0607 [Corynebacterium jeikeium]